MSRADGTIDTQDLMRQGRTFRRAKIQGRVITQRGVGGDPSHIPARRAYEKAGFGPSLPNVWMYRVL
jgi:hypothetical protein